MHVHNTAPLTHEHHYETTDAAQSERRTWYVVGLTACMMLLEIIGGWLFESMALMADGWHMATHAAALGIAGFAYFYARKQARNPRFTFGTGKVGALGGFTSAIILTGVAVLMIAESVMRLYHPHRILFDEAIGIAALGLVVNLISAWLLKDDHSHHHAHDHGHPHDHTHDHNLRAAYLHVLADALTSILAIAALTCSKFTGLLWLDPVVGLIGSCVIISWAYGLVRQTSHLLLDNTPDIELENSIRATIEADADNQVTDLHLWQLAPDRHSAIISLVTDRPQPPHHYKSLLVSFPHVVHVTVEVNKCEGN
jgi:cation diffusion facilitator family transporter